MEKKFDAKFYRGYFEQFPSDMWCIGTQMNNDGQRCAYGFLNRVYTRGAPESAMWGLCDLETKNRVEFATINNGHDKNYQQPTPKERILAALDDIILNELINTPWTPEEEMEEEEEFELA